MKNVNLMNALNGLNSELGLNNTRGSKYDYLNSDIETERQKKSFRIDQRNKVKNFYKSEKLELSFLKNFVTIQTNILLACTRDKKSFENLSISEIYPDFNELTLDEQNLIKLRHSKIISTLYPKDKKDVKKDVKKPIEIKENAN